MKNFFSFLCLACIQGVAFADQCPPQESITMTQDSHKTFSVNPPAGYTASTDVFNVEGPIFLRKVLLTSDNNNQNVQSNNHIKAFNDIACFYSLGLEPYPTSSFLLIKNNSANIFYDLGKDWHVKTSQYFKDFLCETDGISQNIDCSFSISSEQNNQ